MTLKRFAFLAMAILATASSTIACGSHDTNPAQGSDSDLAPADTTDEPPSAEVDAQPSPAWADCRPNTDPFPAPFASSVAATRPLLHVEGRAVVDAAGQPVALRGVNFGGWLQIETWLAGIGLLDEGELLELMPVRATEHGVGDLFEAARRSNQADWLLERRSHWVLVNEWRAWMGERATEAERPGFDAFWAWFDTEPWIFEERSLWRWLDRRFGWQGRVELRTAFQDHFVTELDVQRVAALGLTVVRVPIWYELLETDVEGDNHFKPEGWKRLDDLVTWARRHGVYVVLDLHGAPGGQNTQWHQGLENGGTLWHRTDCIDKTVRLWQALASHFAGEPHVAAYDLLNEPDRFVDLAAYRDVHEAIYRAIRQVDPDHIVILEDGYRAPNLLISPAELGWSNAMYSVHLYPEGAASAEDYARSVDDGLTFWARVNQYAERYDCPVLVGELNAEAGSQDAWGPGATDLALAALDGRGVHWTLWTWKWPWMGATWGVYAQPPGIARKIDVKDASFDDIRAAFENLDSATFEPFEAYADVLRQRAGDPVSFVDLSETAPRR